MSTVLSNIEHNTQSLRGEAAPQDRGGYKKDNAYGINMAAKYEALKDFFLTYRGSPNTERDTDLFYPKIFRDILTKVRTDLPVSLDALSCHSAECSALAQVMSANILSGVDDIKYVVQSLMRSQDLAHGEALAPTEVIDSLARQYQDQLPPALTQDFCVDVIPFSSHPMTPIRDLKGLTVGRLVSVRGVVVSASPARPIMKVHTSLCEMCSAITFLEVVGDKYDPPRECQSGRCKRTLNASGESQLRPQYKASRMMSFQEIRLQELRCDIPLGALPRAIKVLCEGDLSVNIAVPGNAVTIYGALIPDLSHNASRRMFGDCQVSLVVRALHCRPLKVDYSSNVSLHNQYFLEFARKEDSESLVRRAVNSIAPEIFGLTDIKKIVLCMLAGGEPVHMPDGMKIRGDINVLLTGDPGVAKSQILKWVSNIAPRGVFTSGMGSSGVGLTAAVVSDPVTGENTLEPGTLVFADKGICCIDEFDKMNEADRTALHEVMEQQTISLAKAGIITTMNCRAAILAASNPQYGRWNPAKSPMENINIPTALYSRFDIVWVIRDVFSEGADRNLATHVSLVHTGMQEAGSHRENESFDASLTGNKFDNATFQTYIADVKRVQPKFTEASTSLITEIYLLMRKDGNAGFSVTTRSLLGLVRFARALARLRYSATVDEEDVKEASRLIECSRESLVGQRRTAAPRRMQNSDVYVLLKDFFGSLAKGSTVCLDEARGYMTRCGISESFLRETIDIYAGLKVWVPSADYETLFILSDT